MRDIGVIEPSSSLRLLNETTHSIFIGRKVTGQYLQCHSTAELRIFRQIHLAHPARAEFADNPVMGDRLSDHRVAPSPNSRLYLSFCVFISVMNWINSGACLMRFK